MAQSKSQPKQKTEVIATKREPKKQITTKHEEIKPIVPVERISAEVRPTGTEWDAKMFIYYHESGNVPCKINGGAIDCNYLGERACGLGQAYPCSKLRAVCNLSDRSCQETYWTGYMFSRYGTWKKAKAHWLAEQARTGVGTW